ncbi:MAG TPA: Mur ligase family protein [Candidatus Brocadiia bacterium]|nr:Mur ligase family protein [Candidatus Brocadiia bacterium]
MTGSIPPGIIQDTANRRFHLIGIGGVGVSALAQLLLARGARVSGSDRSLDRGVILPIFSCLRGLGVELFPQDGSGVSERTDYIVASTAIESGNPDLEKGASLGIPTLSRAQLLADFFHSCRERIAIGGTSGKTTVTAMTAWCLNQSGREFWSMVGGFLRNVASESCPGNALFRSGADQIACIEADESDGSIVLYEPSISLIHNIGLDHKRIEDLIGLFQEFGDRTRGTVCVNSDCRLATKLSLPVGRTLYYGTGLEAEIRASNARLERDWSEFDVNGSRCRIALPGMHNVSNALAALAVCVSAGMPVVEVIGALGEFKGVKRRAELVGEVDGIRVIDDFAHNPDKLAAAITAAKVSCRRLIAVFQPHGFAPTRLMREELIEVFSRTLRPDDILLMPEIYYAGGSAVKDISSRDITDAVSARERRARFVRSRADLAPEIGALADSGDVVLIMGARDDTLSDFARDVFETIARKRQNC